MTGRVRWWKPALAGLVLLLAVATATWLGLRLGSAPPPPPVAQVLLPEPVAVAPGVYLLGDMSPAVAYAVETPDGLVLIDTGLDDSAAAVTRQLTRLGLDVGRVRAILLTHVHADHSLGAERLRRLTGAKVYAGRADCRPLRDGGPREAFVSIYYMPDVSTHATAVDVELQGDETIPFGTTRFTALAAPGHTPGSVCYLLERPGLRALFTGDVVESLSPASQGGGLGTYAAYLPPLYRGNARDYLASLRRLRGLPTPDLVLPGHPAMDPSPESPRLSPARWHALLDDGIAEMERLLARYDRDGANFLDGHPKQLLPGLHYLGDFGGAAVYALDTPKGPVLVDAPGDALLADFLDRRFKALGWEGRKPAAVLLTSADKEATGGLAELVKTGGCRVVAPKAGLEAVRRLCPAGTEVLTEDDLSKAGWLDVQALPLGGRGVAPVAYRLRWSGKTVLFSGRVLQKLAAPNAVQALAEVTGPGGNVEQYLKSLDRLEKVKPDLWLPAVPVNGQNANLYDQDWARVVDLNREAFAREPLPSAAPPMSPPGRGAE
jgi:glyoxylase-like metal-dependent hydrolase (beta-lactamase superfamily II)